jgi:C-3',4' desaturase CrtD
MDMENYNVVVIGAGIGGLAAGALLARKGLQVTVLEAQDYPGGCAATFSMQGYRFDAGATIGCGFHPGAPMDMLGRELGISWPVTPEPVAWQYRHRGITLNLTTSRSEIINRFPRSEAFWKEQSLLAALLWRLAEGGLSWPVKGPRDLALLARKGVAELPGTAVLLKFAAKTAREWLASHDLDTDAEFVRFLDAQLLVSVQTTTMHANALNAAIALDLPVSGASRIAGGIGRVSEQLAGSIAESGGAVLYGQEVTRIDSVRREVIGVETRDGGAFAADFTIANLTPDSLEKLVDMEGEPFSREEIGAKWSAFVLYLGMDAAFFGGVLPTHLQIVAGSGELAECGSIFASASSPVETDRAPEGLCAVTISTHTAPEPWFEAKKRGQSAYLEMKERYTEKVLDLLSEHIPGVREAIKSITASTPVTWERYTGRANGHVGGYPQTSLFNVRGPATRFDNLFLVGDSIFPGQSLPGVVTGARRSVELLLQRMAKGTR